MSQLISPYDILTSGGKYPDRIEDPECVLGVRINAADLAERVSKLLGALNLTTGVSGGFRTKQAHQEIYAEINRKRVAQGLEPIPVPKNSAHLTGQAVDLEDGKGVICDAIMRNPALLEQFDLYMENPHRTPTWVHLQLRKPASGSRIFQP